MGKETVGLLWDIDPAFGDDKGKEGGVDFIQQENNLIHHRIQKKTTKTRTPKRTPQRTTESIYRPICKYWLQVESPTLRLNSGSERDVVNSISSKPLVKSTTLAIVPSHSLTWESRGSRMILWYPIISGMQGIKDLQSLIGDHDLDHFFHDRELITITLKNDHDLLNFLCSEHNHLVIYIAIFTAPTKACVCGWVPKVDFS